MNKVKYLGSEGSYSYKVATKVANEYSYDLIGCRFINQLLESKVDDQLIIMPLENSISGEVYDTYWALFNHDVQIIKYEILEINLCMQGLGKLEDIVNVYSHPQALIQSSRFIDKHQFNPISTSSTTNACELVINKQSIENGVICDIDHQIDTLNLLIENVANNRKNYTKFLIVKNNKNGFTDYSTENHKIAITKNSYNNMMMIFQIESNQVGSLMHVLNCLVKYNINLTNIKSRPIEGFDFEYFFIAEGNVKQSINEQSFYNELKFMTKKVNISLF